MLKRLDRRTRSRAIPVTVTPRDVEIFKLLSRYRFLRGHYIHAFLGGNEKWFLERLAKLYRAHYLQRPKQQWRYHNSNYRTIIYELDEAGKEFLADRGLTENPMADFPRVFTEFPHILLLCDVLADIELGARAHGVAIEPFLGEPKIPVHISHNGHTSNTPLIPDAIFTLTFPHKQVHCVLEVDCGTEPLERSNLQGSSYLKKKLQYKAAVESGAFKKLGFDEVHLLHVTNSPTRMKNIMKLMGPLKINKFKHHPVLGDYSPDPHPSEAMFTEAWNREGYEKWPLY